MDIKLFVFLFSITCLPLFIILRFSPWEVPQIQYLFLGLLFVIRIVFFREEEYKKNIRVGAKLDLQKKIGRVPSDPEVIDFIEKKLYGRNVAFFICIVLVLILGIFG